MTPTPITPLHSWREAVRVYLRPQVLSMLLLGFAAGLPFLLVFSTLSRWLAEVGISRTVIGFFSWVGITYSIKILWAPVVDRVPLPWLTRRLGKRRSWMLAGQAGILLGLLAMASLNPVEHTAWFALAALLVAFASATQDVALDAYRIEIIGAEYQGAMSAMYIGGYRFGTLVAGAGALYLAEYAGWSLAYVVMAALMLIGMITVLWVSEPGHAVNHATYENEARVIRYLENSAHLPERWRRLTAWFIGAVVCPFTDFFRRNGRLAITILILIAVFRITDITMASMANPFYYDLGYSKIEVANVTKLLGFFMTLAGAALGGVLVVRYGILRPLLAGAVAVALTNLLFALMAWTGYDLTMLALVISADSLSGGFATAAFIAYLSSLTNHAYTATQYALFSSLMTLVPKILAGFSGLIVDAEGYVFFFIYASVIGIPAILLVWYLIRTGTRDEGRVARQEA
jgi:PAT family beta-lactamase induction signal transducer AmpG